MLKCALVIIFCLNIYQILCKGEKRNTVKTDIKDNRGQKLSMHGLLHVRCNCISSYPTRIESMNGKCRKCLIKCLFQISARCWR